MAKYRKRPVIVDAVQIAPEWFTWPSRSIRDTSARELLCPTYRGLWLYSAGPLRWVIVRKGGGCGDMYDWVVTLPGGAKHIVTQVEFENIYEKVSLDE